MAWNPQGGGQGPWGRGPGGPQPPDIEELLRRGQERLRRMMPGGMGTARGIILAVIAVISIWLASGFYLVQPAEQGVVMLFGRFVQTTGPGLHWFFPAPIGNVLTPDVERINRIDIGFRGAGEGSRISVQRDIPEESLMITGDQNIADLDAAVFWKVSNASDYVFNIRNPEVTVKAVGESALRESIGQTPLEQALAVGKEQIQTRTRDIMQTVLDRYKAGILVRSVNLLVVDPPQPVIDSFNEVQRARQDKERKQNEAEAYQNRVVPTARGEAAKQVQEATAYKERLIAESDGEAKRFLSVYETYKMAEDVTKQRLYLEALEDIYRGANKVIIDQGQGSGPGVVPYLPLPELRRRTEEKQR